jgi:exosortase
MMIAVLLLVSLASWRTLSALFELAIANPEYSHILLVLPIVFAFLLLEQPRGNAAVRSNPIPGVVLALAAASVWLIGANAGEAGDLQLTLRVAAIVLAIWATVFLVYGADCFLSALFPMLFLALLVPWPASAVAKLTWGLQSGSTWTAYWIFKAIGVPVTRSGFLLSLPSMDIEVAKECSGIRSTVMLFLTALVLAQWFLQSWWRKAFLALAVLPIGILRNGLRISILSILGTYVNEGWLEGNLHHRGGSVFFLLGLALIVLLLWCLRRTENRQVLPRPPSLIEKIAYEGAQVRKPLQ